MGTQLMNNNAEVLFKAMSDETRLRALMLLVAEGELCVCELTYALDIIQPKISRHLAQLRDTGVVVARRQGQWVYYSLAPQLPTWAVKVLQTTAGGVANEPLFARDRRALHSMPNRPGAACCSS